MWDGICSHCLGHWQGAPSQDLARASHSILRQKKSERYQPDSAVGAELLWRRAQSLQYTRHPNFVTLVQEYLQMRNQTWRGLQLLLACIQQIRKRFAIAGPGGPYTGMARLSCSLLLLFPTQINFLHNTHTQNVLCRVTKRHTLGWFSCLCKQSSSISLLDKIDRR